MDTDTWELAKRVFHDALGETGPARARLLDARCRNDTELRARVDALLAANEEAGEFLADVTIDPGRGSSGASGVDEARETFLALQAAVAGRYSIERELGRGGMGVVYLARDVALDRPVAIKLLSRDVGGRTQARERFLREARTSAGLSHPNIVPVHAVEEHGDLVFFVMGFVEGETVKERVRRNGPMSIGEAIRLLQEVAWALGHAHGRGVVHRDVKPDNVLLESVSGRAVVTDFGISRSDALSELTAVGAFLGTPEYVSPEQGLGDDVDGRSDIYSLGVTCFFALTGRLPFEAKSAQAMITKHLHEPPPSVSVLRPDTPQRLGRAIDRCLAKKPADRFASAEELARAVSEARSQVPEIPAAIREARSQIELLVMDALGWSVISGILFLDWAVLGDDPTLEWGIKIGVYLLGIGLVASRSIQVVTTCRAAIVQGFGARHLDRSVTSDPGADRTRKPDPREIAGPRLGVEALAFGGAFVLLALVYMFGMWDGDNPVRGALRPLYFFAMTAWGITILMLPVALGRVLGARVIRRWRATRRLWARLWQGGVGRWLFRLAGVGLGVRRQPPPPVGHTEALVAGAAADLYGSLPTGYRDRLLELPELVSRLEGAAHALRGRDAELERALAAVGSVGTAVDRRLESKQLPTESDDYASVHAHRAEVVGDLDAARILIGRRLVATMAALENLRLGLLRLQAGVGTPDELTADLRAARELGREVQALLDGERQVEGLLAE